MKSQIIDENDNDVTSQKSNWIKINLKVECESVDRIYARRMVCN